MTLLTTVVKSINILAAVPWVALAWLKVKPDTTCKCSRKAGVLGSTLDSVTHGIEEVEKDSFLEIDECIELQGLLDMAVSPAQACPAAEYLHGDDDLPVCGDIDGNDFHQLPSTEQESEDDKELDTEPMEIF